MVTSNVYLALEREKRLGIEISASQIADLCAEHELDIPGLSPGATEEKTRTRIGCIMAKSFGEADQLEFDGFLLTKRVTIGDQTRKAIKRYVVARSASGTNDAGK